MSGLDLLAAARAALNALGGQDAIAIVHVIDGGRMIVHADGSRAGSLDDAELERAVAGLGEQAIADGVARTIDVSTSLGTFAVYIEPQRAPVRLLIVGAGHIAVPLCAIASAVGFTVTVLDDREEFATGERFRDAESVRRVDFTGPFAGLAIDRHTYIVLVTRAHKFDYDALRLLLTSDLTPAYIGMVGSRRRVRATLTALLDEGITRDRLAVLHTPVGLDIGAETPAEIALSIVSELVMVRRGGTGGPLRDRARVLDRLLPEQLA